MWPQLAGVTVNAPVSEGHQRMITFNNFKGHLQPQSPESAFLLQSVFVQSLVLATDHWTCGSSYCCHRRTHKHMCCIWDWLPSLLVACMQGWVPGVCVVRLICRGVRLGHTQIGELGCHCLKRDLASKQNVVDFTARWWNVTVVWSIDLDEECFLLSWHIAKTENWLAIFWNRWHCYGDYKVLPCRLHEENGTKHVVVSNLSAMR